MVDDEERNRALVRAVLRTTCTVIDVASAAEAYDVIAHADVDLVLLDVMMPNETGSTPAAASRPTPLAAATSRC